MDVVTERTNVGSTNLMSPSRTHHAQDVHRS